MTSLNKKLLSVCSVWLLLSVVAGNVHARPEKIKIDNVQITGTEEYKYMSLKKLMHTQSSGWFNPRYYYPQLLEEDLRRVINFYNNRGYFDAEIIKKKVNIKEDGQADIKIEINEGQQYRVEAVKTLGNTDYEDSRLLKISELKADKFYSRKLLDSSASKILEFYGTRGYLEAKLDSNMTIYPDIKKVSVNFIIEEGNKYNIGETRIDGLKKTEEIVLRRELKYRSGDVADITQISQSRRDIYSTGLFDRVEFSYLQGAGPNIKDIEIKVEEKKFLELSASAGYDTEEYFWQEVGIRNYNFMGMNRKISLVARRNHFGYSTVLEFTEPWTFSTRWRTDLSLFHEDMKEPAYELMRTGGKISVGRTLDNLLNIGTSLKVESSQLTPENGERETNKIVKYLGSFVGRDTRDNIINPSRGSEWRVENEIVLGEKEFVRSRAGYKIFIPLSGSITLGTFIDAGLIWMVPGEVPVNERFFAGGANSVRGFDYHKLGPLDQNGIPQGGKIKLVWNVAELRKNFSKTFAAAIFCDSGNIWVRPQEVSLNDMRFSYGAGLRVFTPIGAVRCDYAFKLSPRNDEPEGALHLGTGLTF